MTARKRGPKRKRESEARLPESWTLGDVWPFLSGAEIERRFEEMIRGRWGGASSEAPVDVFLHGRVLLVEVDLPGVERESVKVRVERGELHVEAHRPTAPGAEGARPARLERVRGSIRRRVRLPEPVRAGRVEFDLEGGVLRVRVHPENGQ